VENGFTLSCLPDGAQVLLFDLTGTLQWREKADNAEMTFMQPAGFYLVVLAVPGETRAIKVQLNK
jgi:hypothetical protein